MREREEKEEREGKRERESERDIKRLSERGSEGEGVRERREKKRGQEENTVSVCVRGRKTYQSEKEIYRQVK